ncbi:hypothetical protein H4S07_000443 [Coemansia furcata]|uniref:Uncharacterized protein n=1 Tax=Coemansia furcata TaxID=417177 RepID=A0ACC1LRA0_9FUNG|nr:hypothetical protein H4S07_000443 [Coemansia furcata]
MSSSSPSPPSPALSIALTRNQYALECGGVLLDPTTSEVCLLFYPDSSEWRLPIGRPDLPTTADPAHTPLAPSVAGCEPPAHAAERLIAQITGYRCSHLHPAVSSCGYRGPQMVEPLALQIEQRTTPMTPDPESSLDDDDVPRVPTAGQYVLTAYYMAWLTQSRFEQRAATLPVGPANGLSTQALMPLAEVTWFKMDTAAQVLSHASDKLALREAIHRMARGPPCPPPAPIEAPPAEEKEEEVVDVDSEAESSAAFSDAATKTMTPSEAPARNLDILRKTATSLGKRGLMIRSRTSKDENEPAKTASLPMVTTVANQAARPASTPQDLVVRAKPHFPRVLSIFYKLVGSSS